MSAYQFAPTELRTIVIAWCVEDFEVVREKRRDLGERPELKKVLVPRAAVWLNEGTAEDVEKAKAYARRLDADHDPRVPPSVYVYHPTREEDPIGRAKAEIAAELGL